MPSGRSLAVLLVGVGVALACARLGVWQLSRWQTKRAWNVERRAALAREPLLLGDSLPDRSAVRSRLVEVRGSFDETRQVLLADRAFGGARGVEVVTPLRVGTRVVLVNRGWLPAPDAMTARPQDYPVPGERAVRGLVEPLDRSPGTYTITALPGDSVTLLSAMWLDPRSMASHFPYPLADYSIRELPAPGAPVAPAPQAPASLNETLHLSYAIQWFSFAALVLVGAGWLARGPRSERSTGRA